MSLGTDQGGQLFGGGLLIGGAAAGQRGRGSRYCRRQPVRLRPPTGAAAADSRGGGGQKMQAAADTQGQGGAANNSQQMQAAGQGKAHVYRTTFSVFLVKINRKLLETNFF